MTTAPSVLLTGIKPTGILHVGNYAGAMLPLLNLLRNHTGDAYVFVADVHALNQVHTAAELRDACYGIAAAYIALGFDTDKVVLFRQSAVREHAELATLLTNVTGKGLLERGHAYKALAAANEASGTDRDAGISMGLFNYPVLMAADILLYGTTVVPVGRDQRQHIEFTRDIAGSFNARYSETFVLPDYDAQNPGPEIAGLDGRKMSKSYGNIIPVFASSAELKKLVMKIVTDSKLPEEPKDTENSTILQLFKLFATPAQYAELEGQFRAGGLGYGDAKMKLFEVMDAALAEPRRRYEELMANRAELDAVLDAGAARARRQAEKMMRKVRRKMGLAE